MNDGSNPPKQRGCFFYGCLSLAIVGLLLIVALVVGGYFLKKTVNRWIADYTDSAPATIEKVEYTREQMEALYARLQAFKDAMDKGEAPAELVLSADDLNALAGADRKLSGKVFVQLDGDRLKGNVSLPLDDIGPLKLKGRHLNGTAAFNMTLENGFLEVKLDAVEVKGKSLPDAFLKELKKENLAKEIASEPKAAEAISKLESFQIKDGKMILRSAGKSGATQERAPPPPPVQ